MFESSWLGFSRNFPHHPPDSVCSVGGTKLVDIVLLTFLLGFFIFRVFALRSLKALKLIILGSLLNFQKAALHR